MKTLFTITLLICCFIGAVAQQDSVREFTKRKGKKSQIFEAVYPIGDNPNIGYKTSMVRQEKILFEANPLLRMRLVNNMMDKLMSSKPNNSWKPKTWGFAWYISYRPQLRMYTDNSKPVKTPSSKISIVGLQVAKVFESKSEKLSMLAFSFESGHFSNGQDRCAFNPNIADGTKQCDSVYNLITDKTNLSKILNRSSGNFSTNYTEVMANYKWFFNVDGKFRPLKSLSLRAGATIYHDKLLYVGNIGGYSDADIKIYGRNRFHGGVDYMFRLSEYNLRRFMFSLNTEVIVKPHPSVNPWRTEFTANYFMNNNMGFFLSAIVGHDNYNYRFVDSGFQAFAGITFDIFPPIELKR